MMPASSSALYFQIFYEIFETLKYEFLKTESFFSLAVADSILSPVQRSRLPWFKIRLGLL